MNVLQYAARVEATFKASEAEVNYEPISTFASDFAIADFFTLRENELQQRIFLKDIRRTESYGSLNPATLVLWESEECFGSLIMQAGLIV